MRASPGDLTVLALTATLRARLRTSGLLLMLLLMVRELSIFFPFAL
jgi:hypothetical protein